MSGPQSAAPARGAKSSDKTRRWLLAGAGAAAAAVGAGIALRRLEPEATESPRFWTLSYPTPDGGAIRMADLRGKPLLLNFWATWCPPCVDEMPLLDRFYTENKANGWQVLGLAVDQLDPVKRFLGKLPVQFPIGLAGLAGTEIARELGNAAGGLPFSVLFDAEGKARERKLGRLSPDELAAWRRAA